MNIIETGSEKQSQNELIGSLLLVSIQHWKYSELWVTPGVVVLWLERPLALQEDLGSIPAKFFRVIFLSRS